jgi:hypothetical protein
MSVQLIITRVQDALEDAGSVWTNADYVCSALSIVNDDLEQELENLGLNFDTQVIILPNVPANTADLSAYQAEGQPLSGMIMPKVLEWRLAGQSQEMWTEVDPVDKVIDTDTGTGEPGAAVAADDPTIESWEWRAGVLVLSPSSQILDLRIRFQSLPTNLNADSPYQPFRGLVNPLTYAVAEYIEGKRCGQASENCKGYMNRKIRALGIFRATQVQGQHSKNTRLGGRRSGTYAYGMGPFSSPIVG